MNREQRNLWRKHVMGCGELTAAQRLVLLNLETFANYSDGTGARPGVALLAEKSGLKDRTVKKALVRGREIGLIEVRRGARKLGHADTYRLLPEHISKCTGEHLEPISKCTGTTFLSAPPCTPPFQAPLTTKKEPLRGSKEDGESVDPPTSSDASDPGICEGESPTQGGQPVKHDEHQDAIPGMHLLPVSNTAPAKEPRARRRPRTEVDPDFIPSAESVRTIRDEFPYVTNEAMRYQLAKFIDRNLRDGTLYANWDAGWRNWMRIADERGELFRRNGGGPIATSDQRVAQAQALKAKFAKPLREVLP